MTNNYINCAKCKRPIDPDAEDSVQGTISLPNDDMFSSIKGKRLEQPGGKVWHRRCPT